MYRTRKPLAIVLVAAFLVSGLVALRFARTSGDFVFLLAWTFMPFLLLVPATAAHWRHRVVGKWIALVTATAGGIVMTVLAWGPFYREIAGLPIVGLFLAAVGSGTAIVSGYVVGCLIEWGKDLRRNREGRACVRCGYPLDGLQKCPECGPQEGDGLASGKS